MPQRESNPMERATRVWDNASLAQREHVRFIWPELHAALSRLSEANSHVVTDPASVRVPTVAPPVPRPGPRSPSAARSDPSGTYPTSGVSYGVPWTQPTLLGDDK